MSSLFLLSGLLYLWLKGQEKDLPSEDVPLASYDYTASHITFQKEIALSQSEASFGYLIMLRGGILARTLFLSLILTVEPLRSDSFSQLVQNSGDAMVYDIPTKFLGL